MIWRLTVIKVHSSGFCCQRVLRLVMFVWCGCRKARSLDADLHVISTSLKSVEISEQMVCIDTVLCTLLYSRCIFILLAGTTIQARTLFFSPNSFVFSFLLPVPQGKWLGRFWRHLACVSVLWSSNALHITAPHSRSLHCVAISKKM